MTKLLKKVAIVICSVLAFCCLAVGCEMIDYDPTVANSVNYTVQVSTVDNSSVKGIDVVFNKDGETVATYILDETGTVVADLPAAEYTVTLGNVPVGYALSAEKTTVAERSSIALVLVKANYSVIVHANEDISFDGINVVLVSATEEKSFELDSNGRTELIVPAAQYEVSLDNLPTGFECETVLVTDEEYCELVFYLEKAVAEPYEVNSVYYTDGENDYDVEVASYVQPSLSMAVLVTVEEGAPAYITVRPPFVGKYKVTVDSAVVITEYPYSTYINGTSPIGSGVGSYEYEVTTKYFYKEVEDVDTGEISVVPAEEYNDLFEFALAEGAEGGEFIVTIERVGEETPDPTIYVTADGSDLPYADDSEYDEYFVAAPIPYGTEVYYNIYDGYYHVGSEYGDIVYVAINATNRYTIDNFAIVSGSGQPLKYSTIDSEGVITTYNFEKYILEDLYVKQTTLGYYPCTKLLYNFLNGFVENTGYYLDGVAEDQQWLAFCYTYMDMGNGSYDRPYVSELGSFVADVPDWDSVSYVFTVEEDTTITVVTENENASIELYSDANSWECSYLYGAGKQSFDVYAGVPFKVVVMDIDYNAAEIAFTVTSEVVYDSPVSGSGTEADPYVVGVGSYQAKNAPSINEFDAIPVYYKYVAEKAGKLTVRNADGENAISIDGENVNTAEYMDLIFGTGSYAFTVSAGDVVIVKVLAFGNAAADVAFTFEFQVSYDLPTAGSGTEADPYVITNGTYQAKNAPSSWDYSATPISYVYTAAAAGSVTVSLADGELNGYITGYSSENEYMDFVSPGSTSYTYTISEAGAKIYLSVMADGNTADDIEFVMTYSESSGEGGGEEPAVGNTAETADAVVLGENSVSLVYEDYGGWGFCNTYWFKFECTTSGTYKISSSDMDAMFYVYAGLDKVDMFDSMAYSGNEEFASTTEIYCTFEAVAGTTYYFGVSSNAWNNHTYTFNVSAVA